MIKWNMLGPFDPCFLATSRYGYGHLWSSSLEAFHGQDGEENIQTLEGEVEGQAAEIQNPSGPEDRQ